MLISVILDSIRELFSGNCDYGVAVVERLVALEEMAKQEEERTK